MFAALWFILFAIGCIPLVRVALQWSSLEPDQARTRLRRALVVLTVDVLIIIALNLLMGFYVELLWFRMVGFAERFLTVLFAQVGLFVVATLIAGGAFYVAVRLGAGPAWRARGWIVAVVMGVLFGIVATGLWERVLLFLNRAPATLDDPIFAHSLSFYFFTLPFLTGTTAWFTGLAVACLAGALISSGISVVWAEQWSNVKPAPDQRRRIAQTALLWLAPLFLLLAVGAFLDRYGLLYSAEGTVFGAGYIDVHFRMLAKWVAVVVWVLCTAAAIAAAVNPGFAQTVLGIHTSGEGSDRIFTLRALILPVVVVLVLGFFRVLLPEAATALKLNPNEITLERPYLKHNIAFTRYGFAVDSSNVTEYEPPVAHDITPDIAQPNRTTLDNVRLWDPRALMDNLKEQQEIRLYYEFNDVDVDRYHMNGDYRQTMLSVRELAKEELDPISRTWVSRKLKYTHGYGLVLLPVHEVLPQGKPKLLIKNIPPRSDVPALTIEEPAIYYGEKTDDHVYVRTTQPEFHYPAGDTNVYTHYAGKSGIGIGSFARKVIFAWRFDDYRLLFSGYFTPESRVLMYRDVRTRAAQIAPFLSYDADPYAFIDAQGHIKYIIDAYTLSSSCPYSERYRGKLTTYRGVNYIRNAVKVVVDAYDGTVDFYIVNEDDPIVNTYANVFDELFHTMDEMPEDVKNHIRYPVDLLTVQAEVYATYHMTNPEVFYQREDVWQFATERYRAAFQEVEPYYVMLEFPSRSQAEFALITPFTPRNKNVLNAWMGGRCDTPHYGELVVYSFPKGVEIFGPRQVEARVDQDSEMSRAMTLWDQRGSEVIRGNLLAIPMFKQDTVAMLYVEPIYLQASDAQLPELKRVVLADQSRVLWDADFNQALAMLIGQRPEQAEAPERIARGIGWSEEELERARGHYNTMRQHLTDGNFSAAGRSLQQLGDMLTQTEGQGEE